MIAIDLDGTLLRSDRSIGSRTIDALHAAQANGVEIVFASGRSMQTMEATASAFNFDTFLVSCNGAEVHSRRSEGRKRLLHYPLNAAVARDLVAFAKQRRYQVNFYHEDVIVSEDGPHLRPWIDLYRLRTGARYKLVEQIDAYLQHAPTKLLFIVATNERDAIVKELRTRVASKATLVCTEAEYVEFLNPGVDKWQGVTSVAEILHINKTAIMALGDGENDVKMLEMASWGVAVANACTACKAVANAVTKNDHNNDAVAEAVERWVHV